MQRKHVFGTLGSMSRNVFMLGVKLSRPTVLPQRNMNIFQKVSLPKLSLHPTADEVLHGLDLKGKTCLITGANSGIGFEMAKSLARHGCDVTVACRNVYAAQSAIAKIGATEGNISIAEVDLASLKSVKKCSDALLSTKRKLDMVILNAGIFGMPFTLTEDKIEATFQVNHLSQFYLTMNVEPILAPGARVVFVSSNSHRNISKEFQNAILSEEMLNLPQKAYTGIKAYNVSKLCNILAVHYLAQRWIDKPLLAFAANPGTFVRTNLSRNWWFYKMLYTSMKPFSKNVEQGASTPLYCATSLELDKNSGLFYNNCKPIEVSELASNRSLAFRVYDICINMIRMRVALPPSVEGEEKTEISIIKPHEEPSMMPAYN